MTNYRHTILIRQDSKKHYIVDITSRLICYGCVEDSGKGEGFCKVNVVEWRRALVFFD